MSSSDKTATAMLVSKGAARLAITSCFSTSSSSGAFKLLAAVPGLITTKRKLLGHGTIQFKVGKMDEQNFKVEF